MKILVLSDLHHDFWEEDALEPLGAIIAQADALILAGDIANKARVRWKYAIAWLSRFISPDAIHLFPGNHDYYDHRLDGDNRLRETAEALGVHFVQRQAVVLGGVRFLCATLWTDLALDRAYMLNKYPIEKAMNDYRYIRLERAGYRRIQVEDTISAHNKDLAWLDAQLDTPFDGRTVVVTHHAPHPLGLNPKKADGVHDSAYASNLSSFMRIHKNHGTHWLYGHSHGGRDATVEGWQLRSVSLGYPMENPDITKVSQFFIDTDTQELMA